jgi:ferric-dicitrate binding protein FerR (iron transport regulator)
MNKELIVSYLDSTCSPEEREKVKNWISAKAENRKYFDEQKLIWEHSRKDYRDYRPDAEKSWDRITRSISGEQGIKEKTLVRSIGRIWRIAATIVLLLGIGYLSMKLVDGGKQETEWISLHSGDEKTSVELSDGTEVWLNANSTLHYPATFGRESRQVGLSGEAYFQVSKNKRRTFRIDLGSSTVVVLGTSFNILAPAGGDEKVVTVATGKVSFHSSEDPNNAIVLTAGEQGVFRSAENTYTGGINADQNYLAWKTGILVFDNTVLTEVCRDLSRHYGVHIGLADPEHAQRRLSVSYDNKDLEEVLDILTMTLDLTYRVEHGNYMIY